MARDRPALQALFDRLAPVIDGTCIAKPIPVDTSGQIKCVIVEGRKTGLPEAACDDACASLPGRSALPAIHAALRSAVLDDPAAAELGVDCVCEIPELAGKPGCASIESELAACQCDTSEAPAFGGKAVDGWCYVDASQGAGNPELVASCPANQQRHVRFVGAGAPAPSTIVLLACPE